MNVFVSQITMGLLVKEQFAQITAIMRACVLLKSN